MIIYEIQSAYDKRGDWKHAPMNAVDAGHEVDLSRWRHHGPNFHGPFTRENWTKPYGDVWPKDGLPAEYYTKKKRVDCTQIGRFDVFSNRAIELLGDYLDKNTGEFLPVKNSERDDLWVYRCMNCIDAIDREKSVRKKPQYSNDKDGWDSMDDEHGILQKVPIERYVFREELIGDSVMFVLPCHHSTGTFVTDKFIERFKEKKLKGLGFLPCWSSERGALSAGHQLYPLPLYEDFSVLNF